jgi:hypothetical protein
MAELVQNRRDSEATDEVSGGEGPSYRITTQICRASKDITPIE